MVGAPWDENGQTNEGIVYVYSGSQSFMSNTNTWTESNQGSAQLGTSVSTAGDVNGDGYADMIIGAPFYDDGDPDEGRAFLYIGSATGLISTLWLAEGDQALAQFGASVSTAGDVNGDGYDDVIIGAPLYDNFVADDGKAFVYLGGPGGLAASPAWSTRGGITGDLYGASVSTAGDVNGDGFADVIVGAPQYSNGQPQEGRASVFLGSASGLSTIAAWTAEADQATADFGKSVHTAGDVNGDGFGDVIIGSPRFDGGTTDGGRAVVYLGSASGLAATPTWTKNGTEFLGKLGTAVAGAGDVNGDGYADVIVGTPFASPAHADVYLGTNLGVLTTASFTAPANGTNAQSQFGISVAGVGDVNGDGFADVAIGSPQYDRDMSENPYGWALVFYGSATGLSNNLGSAVTSSPQEANDRFGLSVAGAGDVNGDGYADVVFGAPFYDNGQPDEGRAFVTFGGGAECVALNPRQRSSDGTRAISHGGASDSSSSFRLGALARTPYGRGKARLEWEVRPAGTPFNGTPTGTGATLADSGISGGPLEETISNLLSGTRYHWRVRLVYDPASVPFVKRSRWVTMPWGGWNEAMLRMGAASAGRRLDDDDLQGGAGRHDRLDARQLLPGERRGLRPVRRNAGELHEPRAGDVHERTGEQLELHPGRREPVLPAGADQRHPGGVVRPGRGRRRASGERLRLQAAGDRGLSVTSTDPFRAYTPGIARGGPCTPFASSRTASPSCWPCPHPRR